MVGGWSRRRARWRRRPLFSMGSKALRLVRTGLANATAWPKRGSFGVSALPRWCSQTTTSGASLPGPGTSSRWSRLLRRSASSRPVQPELPLQKRACERLLPRRPARLRSDQLAVTVHAGGFVKTVSRPSSGRSVDTSQARGRTGFARRDDITLGSGRHNCGHVWRDHSQDPGAGERHRTCRGPRAPHAQVRARE